ncbi:MAG: LapA family protein [Steroidobacteraceae bacterium]
MNQVLPILVCTLAGTVLGALIAWLLTHLYARLALRELRKQRDQLERYNRSLSTLLKSWEDQGQVELARNAREEITDGRVLPTGATDPSASGSGTALRRT